MLAAYHDVLHFVQHLTPTWRKPQHVNLAQLVCAMLQRGKLNLCDLARAMPQPTQKLHGRLKRIDRFLDNPRLNEARLFLSWLKLAYRFGDDLPAASDGRPLLPLLLDTVYFEPFALLVVTVPCGSRGLPVAMTTYHRYGLQACFPPPVTWPSPLALPPRPRRGKMHRPAAAVVASYDSQNKIETQLIDYIFHLASPALLGVIVADRGFARAALFRDLLQQQRTFAIRFDAQTYIRLPKPLEPGLATEDLPKNVLGLQPGQRRWCPEAYYGKEDQVPISLLAVWDADQEEPWYIATNLPTAAQTETIYRWRMRLECTNRDEKTGVILGAGGDQHALHSLLHMHRLLLALATAQWLCALTGLQAWHDLPSQQASPVPPPAPPTPPAAPQPMRLAPVLPPLPTPLPAPSSTPSLPPTPLNAPPAVLLAAKTTKAITPEWAIDPRLWEAGPSIPPPVLPHRGATPKLPDWMRCFAARGWLSYVRLGKEVIATPHFLPILRRMVRWLASYLWGRTPLWRPWQVRYRLRHWWYDSS